MYQAENGERIIAGDATNRRMVKSYLMQYIKNSALMNKNFFKKLPR